VKELRIRQSLPAGLISSNDRTMYLARRIQAMSAQLLEKRVAILAADGFEQSELEGPLKALREAGAEVSIVSPNPKRIQGMHHADKGKQFDVDVPLAQAKPGDFDALVLPGGLMNPDELRSTPAAIDFVRAFGESGKPVGAICHGPWMLIEAGLVRGRRLTSWPAIKSDIQNAGGKWVDEEVVVDNGLVTSRKPDDIPAFNAKVIEEISEGKHSKPVETASPSLQQELVAIERQFWSGKPEAYLQNADEKCLIAFGEMAGLIDRQQMAKMAEPGRWSDVTINPKGLLELSDAAIVLSYEAKTRRNNGQPYHALVSSAYVKRNGGWKLAFHQQTPMK
jgi:protease I